MKGTAKMASLEEILLTLLPGAFWKLSDWLRAKYRNRKK